MKNRMQDVRNHLVAAMESLADHDVSDQVIARAKVISDLAQTYTNTIKVEIDALRIAGRENQIPQALESAPLLPGSN